MWDTSHHTDAKTEISDVTFKICSNEKLRKMRYVPENDDDAVVGIMGEPSHRFKEGAIYVLSKAEIT